MSSGTSVTGITTLAMVEGGNWPSQATVSSGRCVLVVPSSSRKEAAVSRSWPFAACLCMKE